MKSLQDKIYGVLFGQAIGDALGLGTEFMSKAQVSEKYPDGLYSYNQIVQDRHRCRWHKGDWTDDTDMALCIAKSIIKEKGVNINSIASSFKEWYNGTPMGIGAHTYSVLSLSDYTSNPIKASKIVWEISNKNSAANGAVMRTSVIGLWQDTLETNAENICKLTHYDPRCVGSCVIISKLINELVYKNRQLEFEEIISIGNKYDNRIEEYLKLAKSAKDIYELELDEPQNMGYTLKTLSAAIWCLYHCSSFEEGLLSVVNAGGDADTNAAVACSLLGAKYGYYNIPLCYITGLNRIQELEVISNELYDIIIK